MILALIKVRLTRFSGRDFSKSAVPSRLVRSLTVLTVVIGSLAVITAVAEAVRVLSVGASAL